LRLQIAAIPHAALCGDTDGVCDSIRHCDLGEAIARLPRHAGKVGIMQNLSNQYQKRTQGRCPGVDVLNANFAGDSVGNFTSTPMSLRPNQKWNDVSAEWRAGQFYKDLSAEAISEFELLAVPFSCEGSTVVFTEEQEPCSVLFLLEGRVKITMNSSDGKRLMLGIAGPGEILGLAAAVVGYPYESTAVAQFPCKIAALPRRVFLDFLLHYPVAWRNSARVLSVEHKRGCEQLRILGLAVTAPMKLARLLLQWSSDGQRTDFGIRINCALTHGEIGECIGVSRETITRGFSDLKNYELVEQRGTTLLIPNLRALEVYAGKVDYQKSSN
jgi:CRP/FNR family cyclic AMP-dependent transcriptional regulator